MKVGYKHKTGVFGTDAENYIGRLFLMLKNPNGQRRPDLMSINGRYKPRLSLEVKSGRNRKGVMVASQLHYAITTQDDYNEFFGEKFPGFNGSEEFLKGVDWSSYKAPKLKTDKIAYYYNLVSRSEECTSSDLDNEYSSIKLKWEDQYIVPHQYGFWNFAVNKAIRQGRDLEEVAKELKEEMKRDVLEKSSHYIERNPDPQSWQDLHGRDILALFFNDENFATERGKERLELMREAYEPIRIGRKTKNKLRKILIPGPNETTIYILSEPKHYELFNTQIRKTVEERIPIIERITRERKRARKLLNKTSNIQETRGLFGTLENKKVRSAFDLEIFEKDKLERLTKWLGPKENDFGIIEKIPF